MHSKHISNGLAELARANERKRDAALLKATTELFVLDVIHDRDEIRRYEELATHFLPKVSPDDRRFVAELLAKCADAPQSVVRTLARDAIDIADPVLRRSSVLAPIDLLATIAVTGAEHHRLIASRPSLSTEVAQALRLTADREVIAALDDNPETRSTPAKPAIDRSPAARVGTQPPPAGTTERLDPWQFLASARPARLRMIADIAARPPARSYTAGATRLDRAFRSILSAAQIVGFARGGQLAAIIAAIADGLSLPPSLAAAAVHDASGELLAVMLKALRLDDTQARQVFLLSSPSGRDVQKFFPLSDLYAGMEPEVAEILVEAWRESTSANAARHEQHLAENGDRRRSSTAVPSRQASETPKEQAKRA